MNFFRSRSRNSKTKNSRLSSWMTSSNLQRELMLSVQAEKQQEKGSNTSYLTTFLCCSSFKSEISLIAVEGTPSSSCSNRIFFKAMTRSVPLHSAL